MPMCTRSAVGPFYARVYTGNLENLEARLQPSGRGPYGRQVHPTTGPPRPAAVHFRSTWQPRSCSNTVATEPLQRQQTWWQQGPHSHNGNRGACTLGTGRSSARQRAPFVRTRQQRSCVKRRALPEQPRLLPRQQRPPFHVVPHTASSFPSFPQHSFVPARVARSRRASQPHLSRRATRRVRAPRPSPRLPACP